MAVRYVSLSDLFPNKSRATLWRWRKLGKIRKPDVVINNREYYREDLPCADDVAHEQREAATAATKA
jgi:hypothetical protein